MSYEITKRAMDEVTQYAMRDLENPLCKVIVATMPEITEQFCLNPQIVLRNFNMILDAASTVQKMPQEQQLAAKKIISNAIVFFVYQLQCNLEIAKNECRKNNTEIVKNFISGAIDLAKDSLEVYCSLNGFSDIIDVSKEIESQDIVDKLETQHNKEHNKGFFSRLFSGIKDLITNLFDLIENYYKIESLESNFKESIVAIIEKLDRHYIHIGQSTLIGEMIIDYSQYIKKNEMEIVNSLDENEDFKELISDLENFCLFNGGLFILLISISSISSLISWLLFKYDFNTGGWIFALPGIFIVIVSSCRLLISIYRRIKIQRIKRELSDIIQTEFKERRNIANRYLGLK